MREKGARSDAAIARIAARQHGVVSLAQLLASGFEKSSISRFARAGRFHRVHRGVYAVGHSRLALEGRCMAALLACCSDPAAPGGPHAAVSHISAAALWQLAPQGEGHIHISLLSGNGRRRRPGVVLHRPPSLCSTELTLSSGIWMTKPLRTLRDLARTAPALHQPATRRALDLRLVSEQELAREPDLTRSELERMFLGLCSRHRLPVPEVNARITLRPREPANPGRTPAGAARPMTCEVDFLWRDSRLVVETDGFRHHGHRDAFERDRARDAALQAAGFRVLRFTYRQLTDSPREVAAALKAVMTDRMAARGPHRDRRGADL